MSDTMRIAIVGKTGAGKSSLASTIFGDDVFKVDHTLNSGTSECQAVTRSVNGKNITLIDTPGLFDTGKSDENLKPEIVKCITECAPGPHAFLIVLKVETFTEQEQTVINTIQELFSEEAFKYATVLFTHGDQVPEGEKIEKLVSDNKPLDDLVKKCGGRCHVIDNRYWKDKPKHEYRSNQRHVEELLKSINAMMTENKKSCYTNELLQKVEEEIQRHMSVQESREQAKASVSEYLLIRLADIAVEALFKVFWGVCCLVGRIFKPQQQQNKDKLQLKQQQFSEQESLK